MKKSIGQNDIEARNNSIMQNGKISLDNGKDFSKNFVSIQTTKPADNLKTVQKIQKVKEKTRGVSEVIAKFAVIAVASVSGIVGIEVLSPPPITAEISYAEAFDNEVVYCISLSEFDEDVKIVLYNDFTNREQTMEEAITEGVFENLQTNMKYTLAVRYGTKVLAKQTLVTKTREEEQYEEEPYTEPIEEEPYMEPIEEDPTQSPNSDEPYMEPIESDYPNYNDNGSQTNGGDDTGQTSDGGDNNGQDPTGYVG